MMYVEDEHGNLVDEDGLVIDDTPSPVEIDPVDTVDCSRAFHVMAYESGLTLKELAERCGLRSKGLYCRENIRLNKFIELANKAGYDILFAKKVEGGYKATRMVRK